MTIRELYELWANDPPVTPRTFVEFIALLEGQSNHYNKVWKDSVPMHFQLAWDSTLHSIHNFYVFKFAGLNLVELQEKLAEYSVPMPRQGGKGPESYHYPDTAAGGAAWIRDAGERRIVRETLRGLIKIHEGDLSGVNDLDNIVIPEYSDEW